MPRWRSCYPPCNRLLQATARDRLEDELKLIDELGLAGFFSSITRCSHCAECALEVRGTGTPRSFLPPRPGPRPSVGSIVCYLTGLSHVDLVANELSLGRFLNRELASVPDIDLDFPRDIREKLIVRVTERYGREHAALVASFATYRSRGAIRDVGKALGLLYAELERPSPGSRTMPGRAAWGRSSRVSPTASASSAPGGGAPSRGSRDRGAPAPRLAAIRAG